MRPDAEFEEVDRLVRMGMSDRAIAQVTGIPKPTVRGWRRQGRTRRQGPNHSKDEVEEVDRLLRWGMNDCAIARLTGIPRGTVRYWRTHPVQRGLGRTSDCPICGSGDLDAGSYAYLLGLYLGDGCLSEHPRQVFRLRITLDKRYPGIIAECRRSIANVRIMSMRVGVTQKEGCVEVGAYWKHWPCLFPQHGPGPKHKRKIELVGWQQLIVNAHPDRLLRGLIHSDGYRGTNTVWRPVGGGRKPYSYSRYLFTNFSEDIRRIFCEACDAFGVEWKQSKWNTIAISRRSDVAKLDEVVGPKT